MMQLVSMPTLIKVLPSVNNLLIGNLTKSTIHCRQVYEAFLFEQYSRF